MVGDCVDVTNNVAEVSTLCLHVCIRSDLPGVYVGVGDDTVVVFHMDGGKVEVVVWIGAGCDKVVFAGSESECLGLCSFGWLPFVGGNKDITDKSKSSSF